MKKPETVIDAINQLHDQDERITIKRFLAKWFKRGDTLICQNCRRPMLREALVFHAEEE